MLILPVLYSALLAATQVTADGAAGGSALYPPGLLPLITRANTLLSAGQFNDAIRAYSEALEQSPTDYLLYYKRATAYFSLSRHQPALADFDKVLDLTSHTFDKALFMKAKIYAQNGEWGLARAEAGAFAKRAREERDKSDVRDLVFAVESGEAMAVKAVKAKKAGLPMACMEAASEAVRVATHSVELRELRAECALEAGDVDQAVGDLIRLTHLTSPSTSLFLLISRLSYFILPPSSQALNTLKQCLHYDPDSKPCASAHRSLKSLDKSFAKLDTLKEGNDWRGIIKLLFGTKASTSSGGEATTPSKNGYAFLHDFDEALSSALISSSSPSSSSSSAPSHPIPIPPTLSPLTTSARRKILIKSLCQAYTKIDQPKRAEPWCEELLSMKDSENDVDGLVGRGEAMLGREEWEEAVRAFEGAFEASGKSSQDILSRLQKAQKLLKQSRSKDYYKVLGVSRDADDRTIKKAYRTAAKSAHPDKGGSEAKMAAVNEAYEVLSDPELRQRFDNGDDPNDPMAQQGGHPFQQGTHPFAQFFQQGGFSHGGGGGFPGGGFHFQYGGH